MRVVSGKSIRQLDRDEFVAWASRRSETTLDLGAGDGRFVRHLARHYPERGAIGIDLCAANLRQASRAAGSNALFVLADALALPEELRQAATRLTIIFPWGSLLRGLLSGHSGLIDGLQMVGRKGTKIEIVLNGGALADAGWLLEAGSEQIAAALGDAGIRTSEIERLGPVELRQWPTTWAKRLAFGRDPRAVRILGYLDVPVVPTAYVPVHASGLRAGERPALISPDVLQLRAGRHDAGLSLCEPFCSVGRMSAQPHRRVSGASPQEGGLVARSRTRSPQV